MPDKIRYKERLERGECTSCGQRKADKGTRCSVCCEQERIQHGKHNKVHFQKLREKILSHYGKFCHCPGCIETEELFLEFDHINNDGNKHRKIIGKGGQALIHWIINNEFPTSIQVLCSNCNQGKRRNNGICPHLNQ